VIIVVVVVVLHRFEWPVSFDEGVNLIPPNEHEPPNVSADEHSAPHEIEVSTPTERAVVL
jgi:hypothetical protein